MAVAGLHNVSVPESSFLRESQSPVSSRGWCNQDRPSTRASSLLQMWRELEGEHVVSHPQLRFGGRPRQQRSYGSDVDLMSTDWSEGQGSDNGGNDGLEVSNEVENESRMRSQGQIGSQDENEDCNSSTSEQSAYFGEAERERVRQIFREWRNSGIRGHAPPYVSHKNNCSTALWLGENGCERVRSVREWVQMTSQERGTCNGHREQATQLGVQIDQVRDRHVGNHCDIGARNAIRKLCGRQALVDLLMSAERERKRELQGLQEHRPVSAFAHRNRIQSLLRGRFLQNGRLLQDERPKSVAACELGLLRQRQTVSGLREGFLSRLDSFVHNPETSTLSDVSSNDDIHGYRSEESQANHMLEVQDESEPSTGEREIHTDELISYMCGDVSGQESITQVEETPERNLENEGRQKQHSCNVVPVDVEETWEQVLENGEREQQWTSNVELDGMTDASGSDFVENQHQGIGNESSQETLVVEGSGQDQLLEAPEVLQEHYELGGTESAVQRVFGHTNGLEGNTVEDFNWQDTSAQVEEWQESSIENEGSVFNELGDTTVEDIDGNWQENTAHHWHQEISGNDHEEHSQLQESHEEWNENVMQEGLDNWLDGPSGQDTVRVGRIDSFYFPDDDNAHNIELRELLSRRRVSNLLRSGFRESLDQLIQSYVARQAHASIDLELDETPSPALLEHDQVQQSGDQNADHLDVVDRTPSFSPSQPLWDQELHDATWPHYSVNQRLGIEWEIVNDLRIDMARLQQRINHMQRMLEACMDMQLELQRSVRQEVSAALNRSSGSTDEYEDSSLKDESKWDLARKGICCICSDSNIDSLLYRCGHMCTCSKCAEKLVKGRGKCPMCRAPVVETIHPYCIH